MDRTRILVVDDEEHIREGLRDALSREGHTVDMAASAEEALLLFEKTAYAVVIADLVMEEMSGVDLTRVIKQISPATDVVILTAYGSIETAVEALREGAYDYMTKPVDIKRFRSYVSKILDRQRLMKENLNLRNRLELQVALEDIQGQDPSMLKVLEMVQQVAPSSATVLIEGESGTGKELIAKAIHALSERNKGPFVAINCGAFPQSLFESELFGHEKGAFTNAMTRHEGCFERATGGTLFLDEVAEMPYNNQVDFLRVLEEKRFRRLGGTSEITVDVRIIAASNKDLAQLQKDGRFREDLFFRLNTIEIRLPPLRERRGDIALLAQSFLQRYCKKYERQRVLADSTLDMLCRYQWPGNVRELRNEIERSVLLSSNEVIRPGDLRVELQTSLPAKEYVKVPVGSSLKETEKRLIMETLTATGNNRKETARRLGISLRTLQYRLKEYGL